MSLSTFSFYGGDIPDGSEATPGLWDRRFSVLSQNLDQINSDASQARFWNQGSVTTNIGVNTSVPLSEVHIKRTNSSVSLTTAFLGGTTEDPFYPLIVEGQDGFIALSGTTEGGHGSGVDLIELDSLGSVRRWTMAHLTSTNAAGQDRSTLAWYYGLENYFPDNRRKVQWGLNGGKDYRFLANINPAGDDSFFDSFDNFAYVGFDARIRCVSDNGGNWGSAFCMDEISNVGEPGADFDNTWGIIRSSTSSGGAWKLTYGTDSDPAQNTETFSMSTVGKPTFSQTSQINIRNSFTPATGTASGVTGDIAWDTDFIYVCISTNSWKRSTLAAF